MQNIDFLPSRYHERYRQQQAITTWISVIAAIVVLLFFGGMYQYRREAALRQRVAESIARQDECQRLTAALNTMRSELRTFESQALLYEYIEHPWPRSRILESIVTPLPSSITFRELVLSRESAVRSSSTATRDTKRNRNNASEPAASELPPAVADLQKLREQYDGATEYVQIKGLANETSELHEFVAKLNSNPLFTRVHLEAVTAVSTDQSATSADSDHACQFELRIQIRPGYGQPGGPELLTPDALVEAAGEVAQR